MRKICLHPYTIESPTLEKQVASFIDRLKTRQVAVVTGYNDVIVAPCQNAIILHEVTIQDICHIKWYECPTQLGRVYTMVISGCDVVISSFENGVLGSVPCSARQYGSDSFCFGKIYNQNTVYDANNPCFTSFVFDGHTFNITGSPSTDYGIFDCQDCDGNEQNIKTFGFPGLGGAGPSDGSPETPPDTPTDAPDEANETGSINQEDRTIWYNPPSGDESTGLDVVCSPNETILPNDCESLDNPAITVLSSGHVAIAYENRDKTGLSKISVAVFNSSVQNSVKYYRKLSRGTLINIQNSGVFEIFDDIPIDENLDEIPDETLFIGFINGPLRGGQPFAITSITRSSANNRIKQTINFNLVDRIPQFDDSNNVSDIIWFLIKSSNIAPTTNFDLPVHLDQNGQQITAVLPSIATPPNNINPSNEQHLFISYQVFENNKWSVYLRQVILSPKNKEAPKYQQPYVIAPPIFTPTPVVEDFTSLDYHVIELSSLGGKLCALMEVRVPSTDEQLTSGLNPGTGTTTICNFTYDRTKVYIEASFDTNTCGTDAPSWLPHVSTFSGDIPPTSDQIGWSGSSSCIDVKRYPDNLSSWYYLKPTCTHIDVIDDPYCSSPYITVNYKPEELYNLTIDDQIITRVLYHLEANLSEVSAIDFMFVIDHSSSMATHINAVRQSVNNLVNSFIQLGKDCRFGLTIYARGSAASGPNGGVAVDPLVCCAGPSYTFDGFNYPGSSAVGGFTSNIQTIDTALSSTTGWSTVSGAANHFGSIQFALTDDRFIWREKSQKIILLVTDAIPNECGILNICGYENSASAALAACLAKKCIVIAAINQSHNASEQVFGEFSQQTGWDGGTFPVKGNLDNSGQYTYDISVQTIINQLTQLYGVRIFERSETGQQPTFLENAQLLITYSDNLIDLWTKEKHRLYFTDNVPTVIGETKGLTNFPFPIYTTHVYNINPVHLLGKMENWIYFVKTGSFLIDFPNFGTPNSGTSDYILIATNAIRSKVCVNNRNDVFVAYESLESGTSQIAIKATGDFAQSSITGPKGRRITKFLKTEDFAFYQSITSIDDGINQKCDITVDDNDVVHVTWQSNKDKHWEIYYANGLNVFYPTRVTNCISRSGAPSIDVVSSGGILITYHDNRFGNYNIFLSIKDETRILPLLQQDPYLASINSGYNHFTNTLDIPVSNILQSSPLPGVLVMSKINRFPDNTENYIFSIVDELPVGGGDSSPWEITAIAGSPDGYLYGIATTNGDNQQQLLLIDQTESEDHINIEVSEITNIEYLDLVNSIVVDMAHDYQNRLWLLVIDQINQEPGSIRIINIDKTNATTISDTTIFNSSNQVKGGLGIDSSGMFWISVYHDGLIKILKSEYPHIVGSLVEFNFMVVKEYNAGDSDIQPQSITVDKDNAIFILSDLSVYTMSQNGDTSILFTLPRESTETDPYIGPYPISVISGFAYQFSGRSELLGEDDFFHVLIEFYDNIGLSGQPKVVVNSQDNLDAFISQSNPYFDNANGIHVQAGQTTIISFNAALFNPHTTRLAYPYGFATNQTYFPKIFITKKNNTTVLPAQNISFSCTRCNQINFNNPDVYACSYSVVIENKSDVDQYFNFRVNVFVDEDLQSLIKIFDLSYQSVDLKYAEINNQLAQNQWDANGLFIAKSDKSFLQIYPAIDSTEFVCGISYFVRIEVCTDTDRKCTNFVDIKNKDMLNASFSNVFLCECASTIQESPLNYIGNVGRWKSSAHGYADTQMTDSIKNNLRPKIKSNSSGGATIAFENHNNTIPKIMSTRFYKSNINEIFGSGTKKWFDYDLDVYGENVDIELDLFDRIMVSCQSKEQNLLSTIPGNKIIFKKCDINDQAFITTSESQQCLSKMSLTSINTDKYIANRLIKKAIVSPEDAQYYTYNAAGQVAAVVNKCRIKLRIVAVPEIVGIRIKNENSTNFNEWCATTPEISDYTIEKNWILTSNSGIKEVCIQAMTYSGVTESFCIPVIADYEQAKFSVSLYKDSDYSISLPTYNELFVASTSYTENGETVESATIYIEIIPNEEISDQSLQFDILQQGSNDGIGLIANRALRDGRVVFRGSVNINREDNVFNVDGLATIRVLISTSCITADQTITSSYNRDEFNVLDQTKQSVVDNTVLEQYRQSDGHIGVKIVIRPDDDPYLIFGDPNLIFRDKS